MSGGAAGVNALQRAIPISTGTISVSAKNTRTCVNALQRAIPISTVSARYRDFKIDGCQCPSTGNPHFYLDKLKFSFYRKGSVNALQRAIPISTKATVTVAEEVNCPSVNALQRAIPISTIVAYSGDDGSFACQCPSTGNPHFYVHAGSRQGICPGRCQCPSTGNPHFYGTLSEPA